MRRSKNPEILAQLDPARQQDRTLPSILQRLAQDESAQKSESLRARIAR